VGPLEGGLPRLRAMICSPSVRLPCPRRGERWTGLGAAPAAAVQSEARADGGQQQTAATKSQTASTASRQFSAWVRPDATRGVKPWSPSSSQCSRTCGDSG